MSVPSEILQLKLRLLDISPMIWRRVLVSSSTTLHELHGILQVAMGWDGIHLFQFDIRAVDYGSWELHAANPDIPLSDFGFCQNDRFSYIYDMGDYWKHEVRVEAVLDADPKKSYPVCTGGAGACPPEECGGAQGYLARRDEASGYDAWQDLETLASFGQDLLD
ncbi:MAG: plasmid pRiA4b ORF-3 family protein, partial [Pikeienuella sp.]